MSALAGAGREILTRWPTCQHADQQHEPHERRAALAAAKQHRPQDNSRACHAHHGNGQHSGGCRTVSQDIAGPAAESAPRPSGHRRAAPPGPHDGRGGSCRRTRFLNRSRCRACWPPRPLVTPRIEGKQQVIRLTAARRTPGSESSSATTGGSRFRETKRDARKEKGRGGANDPDAFRKRNCLTGPGGRSSPSCAAITGRTCGRSARRSSAPRTLASTRSPPARRPSAA